MNLNDYQMRLYLYAIRGQINVVSYLMRPPIASQTYHLSEQVKMKVQTVLGDISPSEMGITMTHEHLSMDFQHFFVNAPEHLRHYLADEKKISLANVGILRQYPYGSNYNLIFNDADTKATVIDDVKLYKKWCGGNCTIIENTTCGLVRDIKFYRDVAIKSGVNVVAGTGHYVELTQTAQETKSNFEQMVDLYSSEIATGVDVSKASDGSDVIKCGFIGEVGSGWPITEFERRSIRATAEAQQIVNCGVSFHPGRHSDAPFEIMRIFLEAGGNVDKCIMSHLDRTIMETERLLEFAQIGAYCQFDLFGIECSFYQLGEHLDMPSDAQRMDKIVALVDAGYEDNILVSHDVHTKHRLIGFGGHGYSHIVNNVLPKLKLKGLTQQQIDKITTVNPAKWIGMA